MRKSKCIFKIGLSTVALACAVALSGATVQADDKPAIEVITHAGAGGGTDVNSRMMMLRSRRTLKQNMVVVNKRGGGGASAMNYFMTRPADGNTILTFTVGHAITMAKGKTKLRVEDMAPIARGTNDPQILMVNCKTTPYKTPEEFVAWHREKRPRSFERYLKSRQKMKQRRERVRDQATSRGAAPARGARDRPSETAPS